MEQNFAFWNSQVAHGSNGYRCHDTQYKDMPKTLIPIIDGVLQKRCKMKGGKNMK